MSPTRVRELPEALIAGPHRQAGRDPAAIPPRRPAGPATGSRRAGAAVAGFARRLRGLPGSMDLRQLAGPAAVFFLWPPRPGRVQVAASATCSWELPEPRRQVHDLWGRRAVTGGAARW